MKKYEIDDTPPLIASEAAVAYMRNDDRIMHRYNENIARPIARMQVIRKGLAADALNDVQSLTGTSQGQVASIMHISEKTLRDYVKNKKDLNVPTSDHILSIMELFAKGQDVLGSIASFRLWLNRFNVALQLTPIELLDNHTGIKLLMNTLYSIEYGSTA